jgi:hypothetical protein
LLGSTSTFALLDATAAAARGLSAGTNANLTLSGGDKLAATAAIAAGASQSAAVEERSADGSAAVARMVTLTGIGTAPGAAITASPAAHRSRQRDPGIDNVTASHVVPAGVAPTISPNDGRFRVAGSEAAGWRVVVGLSALSAGSVTLTAAATGATSASIPLTIINGAAPAIAPTVVAAGGDGRSALTITDTNPASANVQCWNIYESTTSGSGYPTTPTQIAYRIDQVARMSLANGNTRYYKVAAYNRLGEGPMSAEVSATSSSANYSPLRVNATIWFAGVLNYTMIRAIISRAPGQRNLLRWHGSQPEDAEWRDHRLRHVRNSRAEDADVHQGTWRQCQHAGHQRCRGSGRRNEGGCLRKCRCHQGTDEREADLYCIGRT